MPIIVLTARGTESDRVLGLELGADDYVTKPFSMPELMSRVRAIVRRRELDRAAAIPCAWSAASGSTSGAIRSSSTIDSVLPDGVRSSRCSRCSRRSPGNVVTRQAIMRRLWDSDYAGDEHVCDVHVSNLRHKIERDPSQPQPIVTIRGVGYKLVAA